MKKKLAIILLTCLTALSGCGKGEPSAEQSALEQPQSETQQSQSETGLNSGGASEESLSAQESEEKKPEMKGEISLSVYESSEWLDTAIAMFEKKYPDVKINLHAFYQSSGTVDATGMTSRPAGQTREDYIAQLNTQLLSGKGDDIVITSIGLPLGRYVNMGIFEDLSAYLEAAEEINEEAYYMNVFDAYRTESGALYQMPISVCAIPVFTFPTELIQNTGIDPTQSGEPLTWREALDVAEEMYNASTLPNTLMPSAHSIVGAQFNVTVASFVDYENETVTVDEEKLLALFNVFEEMKQFQTEGTSGGSYVPYQLGYQPDVEIALVAAEGEYKVVQWKEDNGKVCLSPYYVCDFGITGQSENKELAWEFLRFLVSEEVQTLPSCPNAGVCKAGLRARVEGYADTLTAVEVTPELKEEMVRLTDSWVSQITGYYPEDTDVLQIAEGVLQEYLDGSLTAEQAVSMLDERLRQFISQ